MHRLVERTIVQVHLADAQLPLRGRAPGTSSRLGPGSPVALVRVAPAGVPGALFVLCRLRACP
jgi:hypothetical protein